MIFLIDRNLNGHAVIFFRCIANKESALIC